MMRKGKTLAAAVLAAAVFAASQPVLAQDAGGQVQIKIGKLREEMALEEEKLQKSTEEERAVLDELDKLGSRMDEQQGKINLLQKQLEEQRQNLTKTEEARKQTAQARDKALRHMLDRLRAFYTMGRLGALNVTFSSRTLPELMLMQDSFRSMAGYDRTVIEQYRTSLNALKQAQTAHELQAVAAGGAGAAGRGAAAGLERAARRAGGSADQDQSRAGPDPAGDAGNASS